MPVIHFDLNDQSNQIGAAIVEISDLAEAKREAAKFAGEALSAVAETPWDQREWTLTVTDESGVTLFRLLIQGSEAVPAQEFSRSGHLDATFDENQMHAQTDTGVDGC